MQAGQEFTLPVHVVNASREVWSQRLVGPLALGNHWFDASGELMVVQDDGRAPLLQVMNPDDSVTLRLTLHAPLEPGDYIVELDLVHEGLTWFAHRGSGVVRFRVGVRPSEAGRGPDHRHVLQELAVPEYDEAAFAAMIGDAPADATAAAPMHGLAKDHVTAIVERQGGRVVHVEDDACAGPEWISHRYFVRKGNGPPFACQRSS
jgi:hypothetical protein